MAVDLAGRAQLVYDSAHLLHCPLQEQHLVAVPLLQHTSGFHAACHAPAVVLACAKELHSGVASSQKERSIV